MVNYKIVMCIKLAVQLSKSKFFFYHNLPLIIRKLFVKEKNLPLVFYFFF
ncbi:hypothetical protein M5D96_012050 [Drosophila gunungcola]|uniref:Uncharacterized protein n=1 Tax=Drosophila gunungcola TaxID=103775 RepID=A0A9P9YDS9_9MUSC|nr:hypothetical protein M5D96_012050 [Drosophila gunungcola]